MNASKHMKDVMARHVPNAKSIWKRCADQETETLASQERVPKRVQEVAQKVHPEQDIDWFVQNWKKKFGKEKSGEKG